MRSFFKGVATTVVALVIVWFGVALADYTILDSTSVTRTVKAFVCETTKICNAHISIKSDGTEIFTVAAPGQVGVASGADIAQGAIGDPAWVSGNGTTISLLKNIAGGVGGAVPAGTNTIGTVGQLTYPVGATPLTASATGTTGATTATLAGTSGKTTYICGYSIRANATAAATVTNTITGVITATLSSVMWIAPLASGLGVDEQIFSPCIPASGTNQAIAIVSGAPGSGGTVSSKGWGYQL